MTKWQFKEYLKQHGYSIDEDANYPTILMVGASSDEIKKKFFEVERFIRSPDFLEIYSLPFSGIIDLIISKSSIKAILCFPPFFISWPKLSFLFCGTSKYILVKLTLTFLVFK